MARGQHPNSIANLKRVPKGGPSPNPSGRPKDILSQRLRARVNEQEADALISALLEASKTGDMKALALAWDRLEGKVTDKHELSGPNGEPLVTPSPVVAINSDELRRLIQMADGDDNSPA